MKKKEKLDYLNNELTQQLILFPIEQQSQQRMLTVYFTYRKIPRGKKQDKYRRDEQKQKKHLESIHNNLQLLNEDCAVWDSVQKWAESQFKAIFNSQRIRPDYMNYTLRQHTNSKTSVTLLLSSEMVLMLAIAATCFKMIDANGAEKCRVHCKFVNVTSFNFNT